MKSIDLVRRWAVRLLTLGLAAAGFAGVASAAPAGNSPDQLPAETAGPGYVQTEKVRLVLLPTSVTDARGRLAQGLEAKDFLLYESDVLQRIRYFVSDATEPVSIAFLLDVSGSMDGQARLDLAKTAIRTLVGAARPADRHALICFADQQVALVTEFDQSRESFLARLDVQEAYGQTALIDAVAAAPGMMDEGISSRRAIVLITDGIDNFSRLAPGAAIEMARRFNVPVYAMGFLPLRRELLSEGVVKAKLESLEEITRETGGRLFAVHDERDLLRATEALAEEIGQQYLIGYYPGPGPDGFRPIRVEVDGRRLQARTRSGYYAVP